MFSAHLSVCTNDGISKVAVPNNYSPLQIQILQTQIREEEDHKPYTVSQTDGQEYVIEVSVNGENKWKIHRRYKLFSQLNDTLKHYFPNVKFPEFSQALQAKTMGDLNSGSKQSYMIEERRRGLQQYLLVRVELKLGLVAYSNCKRKSLLQEVPGDRPTPSRRSRQCVQWIIAIFF